MWARLEMLMFRFEQPEEWAWGNDASRGFMFDCVRLTSANSTPMPYSSLCFTHAHRLSSETWQNLA